MTLGDITDLLDERQNISDYADFELAMVDGLRVTGLMVDVKEGVIYLSDEEEGLRFL